MVIVGISGSTRRDSFNFALLRAAAAAMPQGAQMRIESIAGIPLYNADQEAADGIPEPVKALKEAIAAADGVLLVTPEYNNSVPGVPRTRSIGCPARPGILRGCSVPSRSRLQVLRPAGSAPCFLRTPGCRYSRLLARTCGPAADSSSRAPALCSTRRGRSRTRPCARTGASSWPASSLLRPSLREVPHDATQTCA